MKFGLCINDEVFPAYRQFAALAISSMTSDETWPRFSYSAGMLFPSPATSSAHLCCCGKECYSEAAVFGTGAPFFRDIGSLMPVAQLSGQCGTAPSTAQGFVIHFDV